MQTASLSSIATSRRHITSQSVYNTGLLAFKLEPNSSCSRRRNAPGNEDKKEGADLLRRQSSLLGRLSTKITSTPRSRIPLGEAILGSVVTHTRSQRCLCSRGVHRHLGQRRVKMESG